MDPVNVLLNSVFDTQNTRRSLQRVKEKRSAKWLPVSINATGRHDTSFHLLRQLFLIKEEDFKRHYREIIRQFAAFSTVSDVFSPRFP